MKNLRPAFLPEPKRERWQPLRGGLVNVFRFDREEFLFEQGRLLLRGDNGSGKSRVLALQLPFLLDGEITPQRVEPDGAPAKRMEWNLLMGKHRDRLGYSWMEFGRLGDDGQRYFVTIGIGMQATEGKAGVTRWYFVTPKRVGEDLCLESETGNPLSRSALEEAISATGGEVYPKAESYRMAVNKALFGLEQSRYEALVSLLIQLRKPQLSKDLNENLLSDALSASLAPIPEGVIRDLAEAFRGLDADRSQLSNLQAAESGARKFLSSYQRYVQIAVRRMAERVRKRHSDYESTQRSLRDVEKRREEATARLQALKVDEQRVRIERGELEGQERALQSAPAMQKAADLDQLRQSVARQRNTHKAFEDQRARSAAVRIENQHALDLAADDLRSAVAEAAQASGRAKAAAQALNVEPMWPASDDQARDRSEIAGFEKSLSATVDSLRRGAESLKAFDRDVQHAAAVLAMAKRDAEGAEGRLSDLADKQDKAQNGRDLAVTLFLDQYDMWKRSAEVLELPPRDTFEEEIWVWAATPKAPFLFRRTLESARNDALESLGAEKQTLVADRTALHGESVGLRGELAVLESGTAPVPPAPYTRGRERQGTAGTPFWKVTDFRDGVSESDRASIEAALEGAGILDAWVTPDGRLWSEDGEDVWVVGTAPSLSDGQRSLADVLIYAIDTADPTAEAISRDTLERVLASVGYGESDTAAWVAADGRWSMGPLRGRWLKDSAAYIGHSSRELNRRRRIDALRAQLETLEGRIRSLDERLQAVNRRQAKLADEIAGFPLEAPILACKAEVEAIGKLVASTRQELAGLQQTMFDRETAYRQLTQKRTEIAADLGLAAWLDRLPDLAEAISALAFEVRASARAFRLQHDRKQVQLDSVRKLEASVHEEAEWRERCMQAERELKGLVAELHTWEENVGAEVAELLAKLDTVQKDKSKLDERLSRIASEQNECAAHQAVARNDAERFEIQLAEQSIARQQAFEAFSELAKTGAFALALPECGVTETETWAATRFVESARQIDGALQGLDAQDGPWQRSEADVLGQVNEFQTSLGAQGFSQHYEKQADIYVVFVDFAGRQLSIGQFHAEIAGDIARRQDLLSARERDVLETHLIDEVANQLHQALHTADVWVHDVNRQLEARPTTTGMKLRFAWRLPTDAPEESADARKLLMRTSSLWAPEERQRLGRFLQLQIQRARERNDTGGWYEHLGEAFDYRAWHRFVVERYQDGKWKALTARTHGTGSSGEKAVALTLPQFAAAASFYETAKQPAPRFILLDEAFAGIDRNMRANCLAFIRDFDLDFVMTSESEWLCYQTLPGVAIYHLHVRKDIDAVWGSRWIWNGQERKRDQAPGDEVLSE